MTTQQPKIIAVYAEKPAAVSALMDNLRQSFNEQAFIIRKVTAEDIIHGRALTENTHAFFLPGTTRDDSSYREALGHKGMENIKTYVQNGGIYVGICAGAYLAAEQFFYNGRAANDTHEVKPLGFFKGTAYGPLPDYSKAGQQPDNPWANHAVVRLHFNNAAEDCEIGILGAACYAQGPWLDLSDDAEETGHKIIACYADVQGNPIAIASRRFGAGKAIFCGVLPEVGGLEITHVEKEHLISGIESATDFSQELTKHENLRSKTWEKIMKEIRPQ